MHTHSIDTSLTCFTVRVPPAERSVCLKTLKNENMQMYTLFNAHVYLCIHVLRGVQHLQIVMLYELIDWLSLTWLSRHIHNPVMNSNIGHVSWKIWLRDYVFGRLIPQRIVSFQLPRIEVATISNV